MTKPPRSRKERLLDWRLLVRAYLFWGFWKRWSRWRLIFLYCTAAAGIGANNLESQSLLYLQATTACLSAIIVTQIVNVFLCKTPGRSVFGTGLFDNRIILWGIVLEIVLLGLIDYTPWGNAIFGTQP